MGWWSGFNVVWQDGNDNIYRKGEVFRSTLCHCMLFPSLWLSVYKNFKGIFCGGLEERISDFTWLIGGGFVTPKGVGGLGVQSLVQFNRVLLGSGCGGLLESGIVYGGGWWLLSLGSVRAMAVGGCDGVSWEGLVERNLVGEGWSFGR
ncbi:hypothetical protein CsSME_00041363 [Camellia sinensis var. sinensis]